jgi:hypothetical protein
MIGAKADMRVEIPEPCSEDWAAMSAEARGRRCTKCRSTVHELSRYTPEEAEEMLAAGPACVRAEVLSDGRIATRPSRVGRVLLAAIAAPAMLALSGCLQGKVAAPSEPESANSGTPAPNASSAEPSDGASTSPDRTSAP